MSIQHSADLLRSAGTRNLSTRDTDFAVSLLQQFDERGTLSEKQAYWLRKLADRAAGTPEPDHGIDGTALIAYFDRAAEAGLQYPKMKLTAGGHPLVLSRCGPRSKHHGAINVTDGGSFEDGRWFGRIARDGSFTAGQACYGDVLAVLRALAADPVKTSALYGQRTGSCCFCRRHLEDYRSVAMGYGPICAEKWGLPWGEVEGNPSKYAEA